MRDLAAGIVDVDALTRLIDERVRNALKRAHERRREYSQLDGERPAGITRGHYLRVCRDHADALGVVHRGKARLVTVDAWDAWVATQSVKVPDAPASGPRSIEDTVLAELGGVRGDR